MIIFDTKYRMLIDTGASLSVVKYEAITDWQIPIYPECITINGIGGKSTTDGYVYIPFSICGKEFKHKFYVLKNLPCLQDGIIGQEFLKKYNCVLNYEHNTLTINNSITIGLESGKLHRNLYITIPPRCEKLFQIQCFKSEPCVVFPRELCEGVFIAGSICQPKEGKIIIQILNTRETELQLNYFKPDIDNLNNYNICSFEKQNISGERVKKLLSLIKLQHLNKEESISIQNICAKYADVFYLPGDKLGTCNLYEQKIQLKPNSDPVSIKQYRLPFSQRNKLKIR